MSDARPSDRRPVLLALAWGCVVACLGVLALLSQRVEQTPDELAYLLAGRALVEGRPLETVELRFQGPLVLLGTQITVAGCDVLTDPPPIWRARLGMLLFPALLLSVLVLWSRAAFGAGAALLTAFLAATNPTILAYGPLLSADVAFTATGLLAAWLLWRWLRSSSLPGLFAVGMALGATAATKYTGLLTGAAVVPVVLLAVLVGFDPTPARFRSGPRSLGVRAALAAAALLAAGAVAVLTLHACYLFRAPWFAAGAAGELGSGPLRLAAALPLGPQLLGLLPEPLVLGADFQASVTAGRENGTLFDMAGNHWAYYPVCLLTKTPLALLGLAALGLGVWRRRAPEMRFFWICALLPPLALLVFCSATRALQMGIRYVLPVVPALVLLAGSWARHPWAASRIGRAVTVLAIAGSSFAAIAGWPHYIGYFNLTTGGSRGGYRVFADGNCDWGQRHQTGRPALLSRHPGLHFLRPGEGARFGRIAAYACDLKPRDPEVSGRTWHWITGFEPIDNDSAAWLVFDVTPEAFGQRLAAGEMRAGHELAIAWLRQRDLAQARAALAAAAGGTARDQARARVVGELVDAMEAAGQGDEARRIAVDRLSAAGQPELALSLLTDAPRSEAPRVFWLMQQAGRHAEAIEMLDQRTADGSRTVEEVVLLAGALYQGGPYYPADPVRALAAMEQGPTPAPDSKWWPVWQALEPKVRRAAQAVAALTNQSRKEPR